MSLMEKFDKTLATHRMVFEVRKNWALRARWKNDFEALANEYGLPEEEKKAIRECNLPRLHELGVHPFYFNPIIRLTYGEDWDEFQPATVEIMKRSYGASGDPETYAQRSQKTD